MEIFNGIVRKIKEWIAKQDRKKLIENTAIIIIIGVIIIIAGSTIFSKKSVDPEISPTETEPQVAGMTAHDTALPAPASDALESRLKELLNQVQGVGKVDVMITYATTSENVPAYDIKKSVGNTEEKDSEGGTRNVSEEEFESALTYEDSRSGGKSPVILKQLEPQVKGVLVVAEGADCVEVRDRIINAVAVVLDVPVHKVQVAQRKK